MNSPIDTVWNLVDEFTKDPSHVWVSEHGIKSAAVEIKAKMKVEEDGGNWGPPPIKIIENLAPWDRYQAIAFYDLVANAVNYQYWYGKSSFRPNDAGATKMYALLDDACDKAYDDSISWFSTGTRIVSDFYTNMMTNRFPAMANRIVHLQELLKPDTLKTQVYSYSAIIANAAMAEDEQGVKDYDFDILIQELITRFPGYGEDLFLKRAVLFFHMLNHRMGWFADEIEKLPIPADYQVPKMLRWLNCIRYEDELTRKINRHVLIPEGSLEEIEIRAASIRACQLLAEEVGCPMGKIDKYLWSRRKECDEPFHLTITTSY